MNSKDRQPSGHPTLLGCAVAVQWAAFSQPSGQNRAGCSLPGGHSSWAGEKVAEPPRNYSHAMTMQQDCCGSGMILEKAGRAENMQTQGTSLPCRPALYPMHDRSRVEPPCSKGTFGTHLRMRPWFQPYGQFQGLPPAWASMLAGPPTSLPEPPSHHPLPLPSKHGTSLALASFG